VRGVVAVACSGGRDSTALLHATARAAKAQGLEVVALHVHHGLSQHADAWLSHIEQQCSAWRDAGLPVRLATRRLTSQPRRGDSVEAWARSARYEALAAMALEAGTDTVLLAHHQRDQAETFLLQALRGGGVAGLSAMPERALHSGITWLRPWLGQSSAAIAHYVRDHRLVHIEDDSNADARFFRNRLRLEVWPSLTAAFPQAEQALCDAARWAQQARRILVAVGTEDVLRCADERGLDLAAWAELDADRRVNALRVWLSGQGLRSVPSSLVQRLQHELVGRGPATWDVDGGTLRRYRGRLSCIAGPGAAGKATAGAAPMAAESALSITRAGRYRLPGWQGELIARRVTEGGVPLAWLGHIELRQRQGGEQFQAGLGRPLRSLKKQYQAAGVPAWEREGPLVYSGGQLVFVPGLGLDARVIGLPGQAQLQLRWQSAT
jgi:tRNA(Ile)-lysidine synthase